MSDNNKGDNIGDGATRLPVGPLASTRTSQWQLIATAPKNGDDIRVKIVGRKEPGVVAWFDGLLDKDGNDCGGWCWMDESEPPASWTGGICWEENEDLVQSAQPTHWQPLSGTVSTKAEGSGVAASRPNPNLAAGEKP